MAVHGRRPGADRAAQSATEVIAAQSKVENHIPPLHPLQMFLPWTPTVDGSLVVDQPIAAMAAGKFAHVPVIMVRRICSEITVGPSAHGGHRVR
jgi:hypothetical protein